MNSAQYRGVGEITNGALIALAGIAIFSQNYPELATLAFLSAAVLCLITFVITQKIIFTDQVGEDGSFESSGDSNESTFHVSSVEQALVDESLTEGAFFSAVDLALDTNASHDAYSRVIKQLSEKHLSNLLPPKADRGAYSVTLNIINLYIAGEKKGLNSEKTSDAKIDCVLVPEQAHKLYGIN